MSKIDKLAEPKFFRWTVTSFIILTTIALVLGAWALTKNLRTEKEVREIVTRVIRIEAPPTASQREFNLNRAIRDLTEHQAQTLLNKLLRYRTELQRERMRGRRGRRGPHGPQGRDGPVGATGVTGRAQRIVITRPVRPVTVTTPSPHPAPTVPVPVIPISPDLPPLQPSPGNSDNGPAGPEGNPNEKPGNDPPKANPNGPPANSGHPNGEPPGHNKPK